MLVKVLGFADFVAVFSLVFIDYLPKSLVLIMGLYLLVKGVFFTLIGGSMVSLIDCCCGIYHVMAVFGFGHWIITFIVVTFIFQKAFISFVS